MSALSPSDTTSVYRYLLHRTLNFVFPPVFLIFTLFASLRRAVRRKSLISWICFGCGREGKWAGRVSEGEGVDGRREGDARAGRRRATRASRARLRSNEGWDESPPRGDRARDATSSSIPRRRASRRVEEGLDDDDGARHRVGIDARGVARRVPGRRVRGEKP